MHNVLVYIIPTTWAYSLYVEDMYYTQCVVCYTTMQRCYVPWMSGGSEVTNCTVCSSCTTRCEPALRLVDAVARSTRMSSTLLDSMLLALANAANVLLHQCCMRRYDSSPSISHSSTTCRILTVAVYHNMDAMNQQSCAMNAMSTVCVLCVVHPLEVLVLLRCPVECTVRSASADVHQQLSHTQPPSR